MATAERDEASLLPRLLDGIAVLDGDRVVYRNQALLQSLSAPGERAEVAGAQRLETLLADPEVAAFLAARTGVDEATIELEPEWWPGQVLNLTAGRIEGKTLLLLHNWTAVHRLANMQQEFVANISHELRTPLTSIRMAAESLQLGAMASEKMRAKFLSNIQREADRLTRLVNELLVVANLHGNPTLHMSDFTFQELAGDVKMTLQPHADLNQVALMVDCPDELPLYHGDRDRIHQVLINLVDNAIKFTPASGSVALAIDYDPLGRAIVLQVKDSGIGVPEIDRPRIFDRFYRVDKSRSRVTGGVGLGLSIVKDIIVAHGGSITLESEINVGTTFHIRLPLEHEG